MAHQTPKLGFDVVDGRVFRNGQRVDGDPYPFKIFYVLGLVVGKTIEDVVEGYLGRKPESDDAGD